MTKPHTTLSEAVRALELPTPTILDTAALTSWEAEVFARGALAMRKAAADLVEKAEEEKPIDRAIRTGEPELFSFAPDQLSVRVVWPNGEVSLYVAESAEGQEPVATTSDPLYWDHPEEKAAFDKWHTRPAPGFRYYSIYNSVELRAAWAAWIARSKVAQPTLAATQAGDTWISIDERLPDNEVRVLVWERWATVPFIGYYRAWAKNWAADTEFYDTSGDAIVIDRITQGDVMYWQPIMAPANTRSE